MKLYRINLKITVGLVLLVGLSAFANEGQLRVEHRGRSEMLIREQLYEDDHDLFFIHPSYFQLHENGGSTWLKSGRGQKSIKKQNRSADPIHIYQLGKSAEESTGWNTDDTLFFFDTESHHSLKERPNKQEEIYMNTLLMDSVLDEVHH